MVQAINSTVLASSSSVSYITLFKMNAFAVLFLLFFIDYCGKITTLAIRAEKANCTKDENYRVFEVDMLLLAYEYPDEKYDVSDDEVSY